MVDNNNWVNGTEIKLKIVRGDDCCSDIGRSITPIGADQLRTNVDTCVENLYTLKNTRRIVANLDDNLQSVQNYFDDDFGHDFGIPKGILILFCRLRR